MDAHLFRRFCDALLPTLPGTRLEKIYQPGQGVTVFGLYGTSFLSSSCSSEQAAKKRHLVLRAERKSPLLFVSGHKLTVNAHPPAQIMRLRKHLHDHRIRSASAHWTERRLYLEIEGDSGPIWLLLDLREGPRLLFDAPPSALARCLHFPAGFVRRRGMAGMAGDYAGAAPHASPAGR